MSSVVNPSEKSPSQLKHHPLGARVPDSTHAVVVSLPTMDDLIGYEEVRPETHAQVKTGYPRFKRHPYVERVAIDLAKSLGLAGRALFPVCSRRAADDTVAFSGARDARVDPAPGAAWFLVSLGATEPAEVVARAGKYLQHTGVQISSRQAEDILLAAGELDAAQPEESYAGDAEARVREAMAPYFAPAAGADIALCRAGMNAMHAAFVATRDMQRAQGRKIWVQIGWLYADTPAILQKFLAPDERNVLFADVFDKAAIGKFFAENGDRIAAVISELPTNPLIHTVDAEWLSALCLKHGVMRLLDPSSTGAINVDVLPYSDLVIASLTKYAGNVGDVMIGAVAVNPASPFADALRSRPHRHAEAPYARDLARLAAQIGDMEKVSDAINANCEKLVAWLSVHPAVRRVHWAYSEKTAAHYAKIARGPRRPGSLFSIELNGPVARFYDRLRCPKGPSFGVTFTIAVPFMYLSRYELVNNVEGRKELLDGGLDPELIRIAVGAEPFEELKAVFEEALA